MTSKTTDTETIVREKWADAIAADRRIKGGLYPRSKKTKQQKPAPKPSSEPKAPAAPLPPQIAMPRPRARQVVHLAGEYFGVPEGDIRSNSRVRETVEARHVVMWVLREVGWTLPAIGRALDRDHTSVLHGVRKVENARGAAREKAEEILAIAREVPASSEASRRRRFHLICGLAHNAGHAVKTKINRHLRRNRVRCATYVLLHIHGFTAAEIAALTETSAAEIDHTIRQHHIRADGYSQKIVAMVTADIDQLGV